MNLNNDDNNMKISLNFKLYAAGVKPKTAVENHKLRLGRKTVMSLRHLGEVDSKSTPDWRFG